jgi:hypothetical protein
MYSKAYRWVAEMEEIAAFLDEDAASSTMYSGMARLYERLATGEAKTSRSAERELEALSDFCAQNPEPRSKAG